MEYFISGKRGKEVILIKMVDYTYDFPNMSGGIDSTLVDIAGTVPVFIPLLLVFVFGMMFIGGMITQTRKKGYADLPLWATLSSIGTLLVALALSLVEGLMNTVILAIVIVITILSFMWLVLGSTNREI